jgi:phospholipase C
MPRQERGVRPARALPYEFDATSRIDADGNFLIDFRNTGSLGVVFHVRSANRNEGPWVYTVEAGKTLAESWHQASGDYDFSVYGPNGFMRQFRGNARHAATTHRTDPEVRLSYAATKARITLTLSNSGDRACSLTVIDGYGGKQIAYTLAPGQSVASDWNLEESFHWYDLVVTDEQKNGFRRQFAGKVENGLDGISDPAIGAGNAAAFSVDRPI